MNRKNLNKELKEKLEETFGKDFVNNKIVIMGLDDEDKNNKANFKKYRGQGK